MPRTSRHGRAHPDALRHCEQSEAIQTKPLPRASVWTTSPRSARSSRRPRRRRNRSIWDANASWNHFGDPTEMVERDGRTKPPCADTFVRRLSLDCFALLAMTDTCILRQFTSRVCSTIRSDRGATGYKVLLVNVRVSQKSMAAVSGLGPRRAAACGDRCARSKVVDCRERSNERMIRSSRSFDRCQQRQQLRQATQKYQSIIPVQIFRGIVAELKACGAQIKQGQQTALCPSADASCN
jgi:hypothetical protein